MAKKKKAKPVEDEELDDDDFGDLDDDIGLPEIKKKAPAEEKVPIPPPSVDLTMEDAIDDEDLEFELEIEEGPEFKYLNLTLKQGIKEDDYELMVQGQSHGFCNILVKHLLNTMGVNIAAYKITGIVFPQIFIRLEKGQKIKDILSKAIETLREEVNKVEKLFQKIM